jgi:hypothetical protein
MVMSGGEAAGRCPFPAASPLHRTTWTHTLFTDSIQHDTEKIPGIFIHDRRGSTPSFPSTGLPLHVRLVV